MYDSLTDSISEEAEHDQNREEEGKLCYIDPPALKVHFQSLKDLCLASQSNAPLCELRCSTT